MVVSLVDALIAGWKETSLIDVHGAVTFTVWFCGCNLRCPFCHNHRLADVEPGVCRWVPVRGGEGSIEEALSHAARFIDYVHVTGGEPLVQVRAVAELFKAAKEMDVKTSLNTNLTLTGPLKELLSEGLVDHVATDLKTPLREMTGITDEGALRNIVKSYESSLEAIAENKGVVLELRIPIAKNLTLRTLPQALKEVEPILKHLGDRVYVIVNPLLGPPITDPRDRKWCEEYCWPSEEELEEAYRIVTEAGFKAFKGRLPVK